MNKFLYNQKNIKAILLPLSIGFFGFKLGSIIPNMLTLSLGAWMQMAFSIVPAAFVLLIIATWNPSEQQLRLKISVPSLMSAIPSVTHLLFVIVISLLYGFVIFWLISNFEIFVLPGQVLLFGSMFLMLILGVFKPELGPAMFFSLYPFLMFSEARLASGASWPILGEEFLNVSDWLQRTLFGFRNIDIVLLMFTIGFIFYIIKDSKKQGKTGLEKPIIMLLMWTLVSVLTANDSLEGLRSYFIKWILPVSIYYATFFAIQRTNGVREIKLAFVILLFLSCFLSIQNAALSGGIANVASQRVKIWTVIGGQMGPWLVLICPLAFSLLLDRKCPFYVRTLSVVALIMALIMAVWEMQRAIFLCFTIMAVFSIILYHHKWRLHLALVLTLWVIAFFFLDNILELFKILRPGLLHGNPYSLNANLDRLYLWQQGWDIFKDNVFFGIGPGGYSLLGIGLYLAEVSSHNIYLEVALESGIFAFTMFSIIIFTPVVNYFKSFIKQNNFKYIKDLKPYIISLIGYYVYLMFSTCWEWGYGVAVFCILGIVLGTMRNEENKVRTVRGKDEGTKGESQGLYVNV
jgi:O-antigen ligase